MTPQELARTLIDLRKEAGLSQAEAAVGSNLAVGTVRYYEQGHHNVLHALNAMLDTYGYELEIMKK